MELIKILIFTQHLIYETLYFYTDVCYYGMSEPGQPLIPARPAAGTHTKALN